MNRITAAAPAYLPAPAPAANADAVSFDLFAALRTLQRVYAMPVYQLDTLLDLIEALPQPVDALTVRQLVALVQGVQP